MVVFIPSQTPSNKSTTYMFRLNTAEYVFPMSNKYIEVATVYYDYTHSALVVD